MSAESFSDGKLRLPREATGRLPHRDGFLVAAGQLGNGIEAAERINDITGTLELIHSPIMPKEFGSTSPKSLSWRKNLDAGKYGWMANNRPDSDEAVRFRLRSLRYLIAGDNQSAFAAKLHIEPKRWNNLERYAPLSKDVAFKIVQTWPDITLDWLWRGRDEHLTVKRQRELDEAGKALISAERSETSDG